MSATPSRFVNNFPVWSGALHLIHQKYTRDVINTHDCLINEVTDRFHQFPSVIDYFFQ